MKNIIKLEEMAMFTFSVYALYFLKADWWYLILIGPDIIVFGHFWG